MTYPLPFVASLLGWVSLAAGLLGILAITRHDRRLATILLVGFTLRACAALFHYYVAPLPDSGSDATSFERQAWEWAQTGLAGVFEQFRTGSGLYPWVIANLYAVTDRSPLMMQAINALFGTLIVYNVYQASRMLRGEHAARRAAWVAALLPILVLYSAVSLRETAIVFPLTLGLVYLIRWDRARRLRHLILALALFAISTAFHTVVVVVFLALAVIVVIRWSAAFLRNRPKTAFRYFVGATAGLIAIGLIGTTGWGLGKIGGDLTNIADLERLERIQETRTAGRTQYPDGLIVHSPAELLYKTPARIAYLLFTPFPWQVQTGLDALGLVNATANILLVGLLWRGRHLIWRNPTAAMVLMIAAVLLVALALTTSNYGTAARHAAKVLPVIIILVQVPRIVLWRTAAERAMMPSVTPDHRRNRVLAPE